MCWFHYTPNQYLYQLFILYYTSNSIVEKYLCYISSIVGILMRHCKDALFCKDNTNLFIDFLTEQ